MWIFSPKWWRDRALKKVRPKRDNMFKPGSVYKAERSSPDRKRLKWGMRVYRVDRAPLMLYTDFGIIWYRGDGTRLNNLSEDIQTAWDYMETSGVDSYNKEEIIANQLQEAKGSSQAGFMEFELYCIFLPDHPKSIYAGFALEGDCTEMLTKINVTRQEQQEELAYWKKQKVKYLLTQEHLPKM